MLIVSESALRQLMSSIVSVARSSRDHNGEVPLIKTVEEAALRSAALGAISAVSGQPADTNLPQFKETIRYVRA